MLNRNMNFELLKTVYSWMPVKGFHQKESSEIKIRQDMIKRETIQLFHIMSDRDYYQINVAGRPGIFVKICLEYGTNGILKKKSEKIKELDDTGLTSFTIEAAPKDHDKLIAEVWFSDNADFSNELRKIKKPFILYQAKN